MLSKQLFDVVIVGSGPSGVMAADVLLSAGHRVALITLGRISDVMGHAPLDRISPSIVNNVLNPNWNWQAGTFLPKWREYVTAGDVELLPLDAPGLRLYQATCVGGLSEAWGANCFTYSVAELEKFGIPVDVAKEYEAVARRIGLSAPEFTDSIAPTVTKTAILPGLVLDDAHAAVLARYNKKRAVSQNLGLNVSPSALAVLSQSYKGRRSFDYAGDELWSDAGRSIWRAKYLVKDLIDRGAFVAENVLVRQWGKSSEGNVMLDCRNLNMGDDLSIHARRLILCAGPLNSAQLAVRSLILDQDMRLPLYINWNRLVMLANMNSIPPIHPDCHRAFSQLTLTWENIQNVSHNSGVPAAVGQLYALRPVIKTLPVIKTIMPSFVMRRLHVANLHFDIDGPTANLHIRTGRDTATPEISVTKREEANRPKLSDRVIFGFRQLRLQPLMSIPQPLGSSIHYAGTLSEHSGPLACDEMGRLRADHRVFVGDSSTWRGSSAKGLTFTLMAHARTVAGHVHRDLTMNHSSNR
jgi:hypothetical protein